LEYHLRSMHICQFLALLPMMTILMFLGFGKIKDKYPIFAKLATVYLAIHAPSAPVERILV
uniref:Uncharacterized protein n=1 Tax=Amphimedon queenslandica TaxID=400682 RepID=A0A1X7UCR3_AMPQE